MSPTRRAVLGGAVAAGFASFTGTSSAIARPGAGPLASGRPAGAAGLDIFRHGYPRTFQFRIAEALAYRGKLTYEEWRDIFSRYDGVVTKVVDEFLTGRDRPREYATRYKSDFPKKMVLVHFNGRARNPLYDSDGFFAGHWLYYEGSKGLSAVAATPDDTTIEVEDVSRYKLDVSRNDTDNLVITALTTAGTPDWDKAEQVILLAMDEAASTITVRRAQYGTAPLAFPAGEMYVAPHLTSGNTRANAHIGWAYNFSTNAPKDSLGRNAGDVFAAKFGEVFDEGGALHPFDGVAFDVMQTYFGPNRDLPIDTDGDGVGDDDMDAVLKGIHEMGVKVRAAVGDDRILIADGTIAGHQRNFDSFNGIENEGWPRSRDVTIDEWSQGHNLCRYWQQNAVAEPHRLLTFNHRFVNPNGGGDYDAPFHIRRLFFAASQMYDTGTVSGEFSGGTKTVGDWDEMVNGAAAQPNWLGMPVSAPQRLAKSAPDLLEGEGVALTDAFVARISGDVTVARENGWLSITPQAPGGEMVFTINNVPTDGADITVDASVRSAPGPLGPGGSRWLTVTLIDPEHGELKTVAAHTGEPSFDASFSTSGVAGTTVDLEFRLEGSGPMYLSTITAHGAPDAMFREFENGVVLANPGDSPYTFDLCSLLPRRARHFRRIQGTAEQDPEVNNGEPVGDTVELGARDGLFLSQSAPGEWTGVPQCTR